MRYYITLLICLYLSLDLSAQSNESWQEYLGRIGQVEDVDRGQLEQLYDDLDETYQTKIDINTCTREELLQLPFLSEQQVMDIMEYRYKAGRIQSLMELYLVPSLERTDVLRLNSFHCQSRGRSRHPALPAQPADVWKARSNGRFQPALL